MAKTLTCSVRGGSPRSASPAGTTTTSGSTTARTLAPPFGVASARGSTPSGGAFTRAADGEDAWLCDLLGMYITYPAIWSARLVPPSINAQVVEPVNVMVRVVYNTLDGIVNDYFVITASVSSR